MKKSLFLVLVVVAMCLMSCTPDVIVNNIPEDGGNSDIKVLEIPNWAIGTWESTALTDITFTKNSIICDSLYTDMKIIEQTYPSNDSYKAVFIVTKKGNKDFVLLELYKLANHRIEMILDGHSYILISTTVIGDYSNKISIPSNNLVATWKAPNGTIYEDLIISSDNISGSVYGGLQGSQLHFDIKQILSDGGQLKYFKVTDASIEFYLEFTAEDSTLVRVWANPTINKNDELRMRYFTGHDKSHRSYGFLNYTKTSE